MRHLWFALALVTCSLTTLQVGAVELLTSGDFETPGNVGDFPHWTVSEFATGSMAEINSLAASETGGLDSSRAFFLRPFEANCGTSCEMPASMEDQINAIVSQTVPGMPGENYIFAGNSRWELNYSGGVTELDGGPFDGDAPPTTNTLELAFLDDGGNVIGAPVTGNMIDDRGGFPNDNTWVEHMVMGTAPDETASVRVSAAARDMVWNGEFDEGQNQSAFLDRFSLTTENDPSTELLMNAEVDELPPSALDFWNLVEDPPERDEILRTPLAPFSNHTPNGTRGVWLSAFFGAHDDFEPDPVDGILSQTVDAEPGGTYVFSGWTKFEQNYSGGVDTISSTGGTGTPGLLAGEASPTRTEIVLEFLDSKGDVISGETIDVKADRAARCAEGANDTECGPAMDGWLQHELQAVAPTNAVEARLSGQMIDGVYNANPQQSAFFDDFSLMLVTEGLAGDYNEDGVVNAADYVVWRNNEGTTNTLPNDPVGGTIGQPQYDQWVDNFGMTAGAGSSTFAVPEPAGGLLLGAALMGMGLVRRRSL